MHRIAIDPTRLAWDAWEWARLAVVYLILALPFALGALAVLLALTVEAKRPGWIYGTSLIGSGIGATVAVGVLWWAFPDRALALPAVVTGLGALAAATGLVGIDSIKQAIVDTLPERIAGANINAAQAAYEEVTRK